MADGVHRVHLREVLPEADVAGLDEERRGAVELGLEAAAEERVGALRREDAGLARAADVEQVPAELHEVACRGVHPRLSLVRGEGRVLHAERAEDAVAREVRDISDARHLLAYLREDVVALRHVAELLVHLEVLVHRGVELVVALLVHGLRDVPGAVAPARGVRHQVDDRHVLAGELRNVLLHVVVERELALLRELHQQRRGEDLGDRGDVEGRVLVEALPALLRDEPVARLAVLLVGAAHAPQRAVLELLGEERVHAGLGIVRRAGGEGRGKREGRNRLFLHFARVGRDCRFKRVGESLAECTKYSRNHPCEERPNLSGNG